MDGIKFKKIRESFLVVLGIVMMVMLVWGSLVLIFFLVKHLEKALTFEPRPPKATEFDTSGFEKLDLEQKVKK